MKKKLWVLRLWQRSNRTFIQPLSVIVQDVLFSNFRGSYGYSQSTYRKWCIIKYPLLTMAFTFLAIKLLIVEELPDWTHETPRDVALYIFPTENSTLIYPQKLEKYSQSHLDLLILVTSDPTKIERRNAIRQTWGKLENGLGVKMSLVFLMGLSRNPKVGP